MTDARFRKLLWLYIAVMVASLIAMFFPGYSETLATAYANEPEPWLMQQAWIGWTVIGGFAAVALAGLIGLFYFKRWARSLSLYSTLAGYLFAPLIGSSLYSGLELALSDGSSVLWGAILALSYFSPVSQRFGR
ncbi:hypothetical protein [Moraxella osloensis]|uniref:Uncharacterized protein n=1 Tax=Faucicola osloensis TaxID=34062 RepID=A0A2D2LVK6_FAUOS|nr:hypothetical protein [Moraxella osloensis]ATR79065.1 hypothetical protein NP7_07255 [Moraxella osloensis]